MMIHWMPDGGEGIEAKPGINIGWSACSKPKIVVLIDLSWLPFAYAWRLRIRPASWSPPRKFRIFTESCRLRADPGLDALFGSDSTTGARRWHT